jgi:DNA-binding transcriptional LysR family regulator
MIDSETRAQIRRYFYAEHWKVGTIARELGVHPDAVRNAIEAVAPHRSGALGRVRIGTGATACIYLLPPILRSLRARMPGLEIVIRTGNTPDMLKLLEANTLDVALVTLPVRGRSFQVTKVYDDELVAVFPTEDATASGAARPITPSLLVDKPLVLYEAGGNARRAIDGWFRRAGVVPTPVMELGSVEAIKELVGAGFGWAVLPRLAVAGIRAEQGIVARSLSPKLHRSLGVVLRRDKHLSAGLREVVKALSNMRPEF